jgi:hypothetical protein
MSGLRKLFSCCYFAPKDKKVDKAAAAPEVAPLQSRYANLVIDTAAERSQSPSMATVESSPHSIARTTQILTAASPAALLSPLSSVIPEDVSVSPQSLAEKIANRRTWLANIRRIKSSPYYNAAGDLLSVLAVVDKAYDGEAKLTPTEKQILARFETNPVALGCISPRFCGFDFEFVQKITHKKSAQKNTSSERRASYTLSEELPNDHFIVTFNDLTERKDHFSANFFVTNHENVVVVTSQDDFDKAKLFQASYPGQAKLFGFLRILCVDPIKKMQIDYSDHPDWQDHEPMVSPRQSMIS